jgi:kinesin family protein 2/24
VGRALLTPGVQPEKAKLLYFKLWALHIDSRSLPPSSDTPDEKAPTKTTPKKVQKSRVINPGAFFRLDEHSREDDVKIVMVMAPEPPKKNGKEEAGYICGAVRPSGGVEGAYELFVADQKIIKTPALGDEVTLKYDSETRCYYVRE